MTMKKFRRLFLFSALLVLNSSCNEKGSDSPGEIPGNEVITSWNELGVTVANQHDQFFSFIGVRALTMMHVAMHDAVNAIKPEYAAYAYKEKIRGADPVAACSQAAYTVLASIYPAREDTLRRELNKWLAIIPGNAAKDAGIKLGQQTAEAILEKRQGDGHEATAPYTPRNVPGAYQYTPGFENFVWRADLAKNKPFAIQSASQFRVQAPPALTSDEYTSDFDEVKTFGVKGSTARTTDQTNYAHWWAEFGEHGWNRIGRITATERKLSLHKTARMFALINMTIYDLYLCSTDSKYYYDTWRPFTAIRKADTDNNAATAADTAWKAEMIIPPLPEYPSGHSAVGAAGAVVVGNIFGTKNVSFEMESVTALPEGKRRSYPNLDSAANECARSRIMNGYHFRFSTVAGKNQGRLIAEYIVSNQLLPVD